MSQSPNISPTVFDNPMIPLEIALWDAKTIATYLRRDSVKSVLETVVVVPGFPRPVRIPTTRGPGQPRWKAVEVIAYVESFQVQ